MEGDRSGARDRRVRTMRAAGVGIIVAGLVGLAVLGVYVESEASLALGGTRVEGTIQGVYDERDHNDDVQYHPIVRYTDAQGAAHELKDDSLLASSEPLARRWVGHQRTVVVDPAEPDRAASSAVEAISDPESVLKLVVMAGIGLGAIFVGAVVLKSSFPAPKRIRVRGPSAWPLVAVGLVVSIVGAAFAWGGLRDGASGWELQERGLEVQGTIVGFEHVGGGGGKYGGTSGGYYPVVEYTDQEGEIYQARFGTRRAGNVEEARAWLGEEQLVRRHPEEPAVVMTDPDDFALSNVFIPFVVGVAGAVAVPGGWFMIGMSVWWTRRRRRAMQQQDAKARELSGRGS